MRRRLIGLGALGAVILGIGVAVAASGGQTGEQPPTTTPTTGLTGGTGETGGTGATGELGKFIDAADAICSDTDVQIVGLAAGSDSEDPSADDVATEAGLIDAQLSQIDRLEQPRENQEVLADYLDGLDAQGQALGDLELGLGNGDDTTISDAQAALATARDQSDSAAAEYGFDDCAGGETDLDADIGAVAPTETTPTDLGEAVEQATTPETVPVAPEAPPTTPVDPGDGGDGGGGGIGTDPPSGGTDDGGSGTGSGGISP